MIGFDELINYLDESISQTQELGKTRKEIPTDWLKEELVWIRQRIQMILKIQNENNTKSTRINS